MFAVASSKGLWVLLSFVSVLSGGGAYGRVGMGPLPPQTLRASLLNYAHVKENLFRTTRLAYFVGVVQCIYGWGPLS